MSDFYENEEFRNSISTVNKEGKRVWVYPKKPSGRFYNARTIVSVILLIILFATPFIKLNGHPFMLFNIFERNFIFFGIAFGPYDFHIMVLVMIAFIVFIFLFTAIFGRVFCGWVCPQTIFMEMVFRKIEYWIDGDFRQQKALKDSPWNGQKIFKRSLKFGIFLVISYLISHTFMAYLIGVDEVLNVVKAGPAEHPGGFIAINVFTGLFFFVFWWFREQACIIVCPYGRLQGVLLDKNSIAVAYDFIRGEPREKIKKGAERTAGDCIDCKICVDVCPTGIDIRNGTQLECVNCTACIDACDNVMEKIGKPRGLIRYDSLSGIEEKKKLRFTARMGVYTAVLTLLIALITVLMLNRKDVEVNILRTPGMLYQEQPGNQISNIYNFHVINKTFDKIGINMKVKNMDAKIVLLGSKPEAGPQQVMEGKFMIIIDKSKIEKLNTKLEIGVYQNNQEIDVIKTSFLGKRETNEKN
ncbi:MAG: cytochrome c oxidase accessory protein CcoG [Ignavibacteriaceae bacterium]|nr:cytochrome c oxidase accessory protein CcoG [Ignavibacteriaceae bacterium]